MRFKNYIIEPHADLANAKLKGANLQGANLEGADLSGADLRRANLVGANLADANLVGANLKGAQLWGAEMLGADLHRANLDGANLEGSSLRKANLDGANLEGAKLIRRNYLSGTDLETIEKIAMSGKDSSGILTNQERKPYREISIALTNIMNQPGSFDDILLEESDQIIIPMKDNMVSVYGEVFKQITISYEATKKLKNYIYDAGGVTASSNKQNIFVIYPNGKAANIKHTFLFFRKYPKITAGSRIFVPKEPEKKGTDSVKAGLIISSISAFVTAAALAYQLTK